MSEKDPTEKQANDKILETLRELGGKKFQQSDVTFEGTRLVIPERLSALQARKVLDSYIESQEEPTEFSRTFRFRPWDGALALKRALLSLTGTAGIPKAQFNAFFGKRPPKMVSVSSGIGQTEQVPWGTIEVPLFEGIIETGAIHDNEYGLLFAMTISCPRKFSAEIEGLFRLIQDELEHRSIYKGKAFDGQENPEFLDLTAVDPKKVIYAEKVKHQLTANIWAMLEHTEVMRQNEVPLKRAVLLHGDFGTGKTLAAFLTGQKAIQNGWTFIYCRPGRDDLGTTMATARLYQPSVVFFEDVDTVANAKTNGSGDKVSGLLDLFDGIQAKGTEILVVLTTNHPEKIHKGMVRPGRLDAVIEIGALDTQGFKEMVEAVVDPKMRSKALNYEEIGRAFEGFLPAFAREAIDRAKRYAIARAKNGDIPSLSTNDFVLAAEGLRPQLDMMRDAPELGQADHLSEGFQDLIKSVLSRTVLDNNRDRVKSEFGMPLVVTESAPPSRAA